MNELVSGGNCPHPHIGWSVTYPDIWMEVAIEKSVKLPSFFQSGYKPK